MRISNKYLRGILLGIATLLIVSCAAAPVAEKEEAGRLPEKEQERLAMETFNSMLELTANVSRRAAIPELESGYRKIISEYPDTRLAQESYFRLMLLNIEDFEVPRMEEAERLYNEYFKKYPEPKFANPMNFYISRFYFNFGHWDKLARFCTPHVKQYLKTGKTDTLCLLYYSEAKFQLKEYDEARRGYNLVLKEFAGSDEARFAEKRLEEIQNRIKDQ